MNSQTSSDFRRGFAQLPKEIQRQARQAYRQFSQHPEHPSLKFKKLPPFEDIWSVRISVRYRALGRRRGNTILWFFIGSHAEYDRAIEML